MDRARVCLRRLLEECTDGHRVPLQTFSVPPLPRENWRLVYGSHAPIIKPIWRLFTYLAFPAVSLLAAVRRAERPHCPCRSSPRRRGSARSEESVITHSQRLGFAPGRGTAGALTLFVNKWHKGRFSSEGIRSLSGTLFPSQNRIGHRRGAGKGKSWRWKVLQLREPVPRPCGWNLEAERQEGDPFLQENTHSEREVISSVLPCL